MTRSCSVTSPGLVEFQRSSSGFMAYLLRAEPAHELIMPVHNRPEKRALGEVGCPVLLAGALSVAGSPVVSTVPRIDAQLQSGRASGTRVPSRCRASARPSQQKRAPSPGLVRRSRGDRRSPRSCIADGQRVRPFRCGYRTLISSSLSPPEAKESRSEIKERGPPL